MTLACKLTLAPASQITCTNLQLKKVEDEEKEVKKKKSLGQELVVAALM